MKKECALCGKKALEKKRGVFHFEAPDDGSNPDAFEFSIDVPDSEWEKCSACGEVILSKELDRKLERWQYTREGLLTPEEIKAIREKYGLMQVAMARLLGVGEKNFSRWETGLSMQTKAMDSIIRRFDRCPDEFLKESGESKPRIVAYLAWIAGNKRENPNALAAHGGSCGIKDKEILGRHIKSLLEISK